MADSKSCPNCGLPMTACHFDIELKEHTEVLSYICDATTPRSGCGFVEFCDEPSEEETVK